MYKSKPIPIPEKKKPHFAKPKINLKGKPKINPISIKVKSQNSPLIDKRKEIITFIEDNFSSTSLERMTDQAVRSYVIPNVDLNNPDLLIEEMEWGKMILDFNKKYIMETLSDQEIDYLYSTKNRIVNPKNFQIKFMDEEEMSATLPADYFIFNLKGELMLVCYR